MLVGMTEIGERLGYPTDTIRKWRQRDLLPEPAATLAMGPIWTASSIDQWADETNRKRN